MTRGEFIQAATEAAIRDRTQHLQATILFNVAGDVIRFKPATISFELDAHSSKDCLEPEFYCDNWEHLLAILQGSSTINDALSDGTFASNGYLPRIFTLLSVFQQEFPDQPPP